METCGRGRLRPGLGALRHAVLLPLELHTQGSLLAPAFPTLEESALPGPGEAGRKHVAAVAPCHVIL